MGKGKQNLNLCFAVTHVISAAYEALYGYSYPDPHSPGNVNKIPGNLREANTFNPLILLAAV